MNANKIEVRFTEAAEPKNSTYVLVIDQDWSGRAYLSIVAAVHAGLATGKRFTVQLPSGACVVVAS